ncbi:MAG: peptidylprolyl isomerase [Oscillospiraceae bacterium]|nr:peptidylprolyl isomerase [Oscillospiraceae bacterium]
MLKFRKLAALAMSIAMLTTVFTGCGDEENSSSAKTSGSESSESESSKSETPAAAGDVVNFTPPEKGEDIIVMTIKDYGDVKIKLFPEQAEKGVENFTSLAKDGYYDGLIFHRVINNFMIQGGDPLGNGTGGESKWGDKFDGGTSPDLTHVAGAVAYANSGSTATNGSQFYIVTGEKYDEATLSDLTTYYGISMTDNTKKLYSELGGAPWLDGSYTIFGQVFDGLDIIFDIQGVATGANDKPEKDVVIEKVSVEKYDGEDVKFYLSDYE